MPLNLYRRHYRAAGKCSGAIRPTSATLCKLARRNSIEGGHAVGGGSRTDRRFQIDRLQPTEWRNQLGVGSWGGGDVKTMIMLLCWTGLRISDAATFDMSRVTLHPEGGANVFLRMHKTNGALFTWVDDWLYERLLARQRRFGPHIFACGASRRLETGTDLWLRRINKAFDLAGSFECGRPTPHIFRHTFVRLLLQRGISTRDVAELIGDTEDVVLKHYARWVPERQERLTRILRKKLSSAPRGRVFSLAPNGVA